MDGKAMNKENRYSEIFETIRYGEIFETILTEHFHVAKMTDPEDIEKFIGKIINAKRIFVMGAGREGIACRSFAMRLSHLGIETHWIWDDTTPGMGEGDLFIVADGRGDIGMFRYILERAKEARADIAMVTGYPKGASAVQYADTILYVPAKVYGTDNKDAVQTIQPMGNLFEQHMFLMFDVIIMILAERLQKTYAQMEARHRNIE